jgi:hypothetical protein
MEALVDKINKRGEKGKKVFLWLILAIYYFRPKFMTNLKAKPTRSSESFSEQSIQLKHGKKI